MSPTLTPTRTRGLQINSYVNDVSILLIKQEHRNFPSQMGYPPIRATHPVHLHHFRTIDPSAEHYSHIGCSSDGIYNLMTSDGKVVRRSSVKSDKIDDRDVNGVGDGDDALERPERAS